MCNFSGKISAKIERLSELGPKPVYISADATDVGALDAAKPQKRYVPKRAEPAAAAPVRRRRDSAGDPGTQKAKKPTGKAACKKKAKPE